MNRARINAKLSLYQTTLEKAKPEKIIAAIKEDWNRELKPLLALVPDFADARAIVLEGLRQQ